MALRVTVQLFTCDLLVAQTWPWCMGHNHGFGIHTRKAGKIMTEGFVWFVLFCVLSCLCPLCHVKPHQTVLMTSCSALLFAFQTEMGSALHEAALFGKTDVVQILLGAGERSAALLSTQHARVGIVSPSSPRGSFAGRV